MKEYRGNITFINYRERGAHTHLDVFVNNAHAGTLVVRHEEAGELVRIFYRDDRGINEETTES